MDTKRFLLPLWACGWVGFEAYETAKQAYPEPRRPSAIARLTPQPADQYHSETGETGEQLRAERRSSAETGGLVFDDDGWWDWHVRNVVAPRAVRSSNTVFVPGSYSEF